MSTAVAPPTAASLPQSIDRAASPKSYPHLAPLSAAAPSSSSSHSGPPSGSAMASTNNTPDKTTATTPNEGGKRSPNTSRSGGPKISVKKEPPSSPGLQPTRHRPSRLDLSSSNVPRGPMTAREGNLAVQDVGLACLSPGFQTQDPAMREQLQRSVAVRDQQRSIIESRLQQSAKGEGPDGKKPSESNLLDPSGPKSGKKRPPGLSIVPPSASQFASERVIQSAPLNQTFTGRRQAQPSSRHFLNNPSEMTASSPNHIHHTPANQTNNRLPPITDVFGSDTLAPRDRDGGNALNGLRSGATGPAPPSAASHTNNNNLGPLPSPGNLGNSAGSGSAKRAREYRSAEEAVHELAGGREDLLPRIVHYNGSNQQQQQQPGSPSSSAGNQYGNGSNGLPHHPAAPANHFPQQTHLPIGTGRRRTRTEYEQENGSPPLGRGPDSQFRRVPASATYGSFGAGQGQDSPETQRKKKDEFLSLCSRAWDLFHS